MPETIDGDIALNAIRLTAIYRHHIDYRNMNEIEFSEAVQRVDFDWNTASYRAEIPKQRLKRWFFETYQRQICEPMEKDDVILVKNKVYAFYRNTKSPTKQQEKEMQNQLLIEYKQQYNRQQMLVVISNAKQVIRKQHNKEENNQLVDMVKQLMDGDKLHEL